MDCLVWRCECARQEEVKAVGYFTLRAATAFWFTPEILDLALTQCILHTEMSQLQTTRAPSAVRASQARGDSLAT